MVQNGSFPRGCYFEVSILMRYWWGYSWWLILIYIYIFLCFMLVSWDLSVYFLLWLLWGEKQPKTRLQIMGAFNPRQATVPKGPNHVVIRILILSVHSWHNILQIYIQVVDLTHITPLKAHLVWQALWKTLGTSRRWSHITSIVFCNDYIIAGANRGLNEA